jgi:hypothetical protein
MMKRFAFLFALVLGACVSHAGPVATVNDGVFSNGYPIYTQDGTTGKWTVDIDVVETGSCCGMEVFLGFNDEFDRHREDQYHGEQPVRVVFHATDRSGESIVRLNFER